jgi:hypothetical protein
MSFICTCVDEGYPKEGCPRGDNLCCRACPQSGMCDVRCDEEDFIISDCHLTTIDSQKDHEDFVYECEHLKEGFLHTVEME